ncbi:MAG: hypothetical protein ACI910_000614 [Oleispira sp.]|jgi:hypothetical protein
MKSYFLLVSILYLLAGTLANVVLAKLNIGSSGLIALLASALAFGAHIYMEGMIITDDYESKITFKDHLSDSKYCGFIGALVFIPSVIIGAGWSLLVNNSLIAGLVIVLIGALIGWVGWRYANA